MNPIITNLESKLKDQLQELAKQITITEENLLRTKEGFLKVQGALEAIEVLKAGIKATEEQKEEETKEDESGGI